MKVLHLFSNHKWTGPAEPALRLCASLRELGVKVDFACSAGPDLAQNRIVSEARNFGIEPILNLRLSKHRHPWRNRIDAQKLRKLIAERGYTLLHCHLDNDHAIGAAAVRSFNVRPAIVRSSYYGDGFEDAARYLRLIGATQFLIEPSALALERDASRFAISPDACEVISPAIDLERFDPTRNLPDMRAKLGIRPDAFVVGIVARMQTHRRYEDLVEAARQIRQDAQHVEFVFVGRGTKQDRVAYDPICAAGLQDCTHFTGYLSGDDYVAVLKSFDVKVFLVPGSDGTCRAVREAMAMARPVIAARRGMLGEMLRHEEDGLLFDGSAAELVKGLRRLLEDEALRRRLGDAARNSAVEQFNPIRQAERVQRIYRRLLGN